MVDLTTALLQLGHSDAVLDEHMTSIKGAAYVGAGAAAAGTILLLGRVSVSRSTDGPTEADALVCKGGS